MDLTEFRRLAGIREPVEEALDPKVEQLLRKGTVEYAQASSVLEKAIDKAVFAYYADIKKAAEKLEDRKGLGSDGVDQGKKIVKEFKRADAMAAKIRDMSGDFTRLAMTAGQKGMKLAGRGS